MASTFEDWLSGPTRRRRRVRKGLSPAQKAEIRKLLGIGKPVTPKKADMKLHEEDWMGPLEDDLGVVTGE
jgi:hypothetical protein